MADNADGEVRIATTIDTENLQKQLDQVKSKLDKTGKDIEKKGGSFKKLGDFIKSGGVSAAVGGTAAAVAIKKTVDVLNDCAAAYKVQEKAEAALQIAAKNNPYLNEESVYNLKQFAGELQNMSEYGDELSIKVMSQLAATGRTEEEIRQIMTAAADMAAVTKQDLASAAQQLNATLNGNAGTLGRQIAGISNLTEEELKNGKAIELVAKQYKGSAAATADVGVQLNNTWGDFKENIGKGWDEATSPVKQFFLGILNDINEAAAKAQNLKGAKNANNSGNGTAGTYKTELDDATNYLNKLEERATRARELLEMEKKELKKSFEYTEFTMWNDSSNPIQDFKNLQQDIINQAEEQRKKVTELTNKYNELSAAEKKAADEAAAAAKAEQTAKAAADRDAEAAKYINDNKKALEAQIKALELKAEVTGEEIDEQEIYNAYLQSYIDLITKSNGLVSENNSAAKERLANLEKEAQKLKEITDAEERKAQAERIQNEAEQLLAGYGNNSIYDEYIAKQNELLKLKEKINNSEVLSEQQKAEKIKAIDEAMAENRRNLWAGLADEINNYSQQVNQVIQDAASMALETEKNRMSAELDNLELLYRKGELSEEEYQKKVSEAKKKGAKVQYQIEMGQWAANILTATANTAVGVTAALAQGGVAGIITGALVGAAGAVQLASIIASKPVPHFATGGYIGGMNGASLGSDNTMIAARGGELVVNAAQQRQLWDVLNGNAGGLGGINLVVNNSASNMVSTSAQIDRNKIELMIDARVNEGLKRGRFNAGLNAANNSMSGDFYGL